MMSDMTSILYCDNVGMVMILPVVIVPIIVDISSDRPPYTHGAPYGAVKNGFGEVNFVMPNSLE